MNLTYKYLPIERISYFNDEFLRITQPSALNDPYECVSIPPSVGESIKLCVKSHSDFLKSVEDEEIPEIEKRNKIESFKRLLKIEIDKIKNNDSPNYRDSLVTNQLKRINSNIFILSFSKRWNSSMMWAHYCQNHTGFCIGFDKNHPIFNLPNGIGGTTFFSVKYSNRRVKIPVEIANRDTHLKYAIKTIRTKSKDWIYEKEERLIATPLQINKTISSSPFDVNLMRIPHSAIKEIIVGVRISPEDLNVIKEFALKMKIDIYKCNLSDSKFDMIRNKL